jgi:hypothetical protein
MPFVLVMMGKNGVGWGREKMSGMAEDLTPVRIKLFRVHSAFLQSDDLTLYPKERSAEL